MIDDQREAAFVIDESDGVYKIVGYTLPREVMFSKAEKSEMLSWHNQ